MNYSEKLKDPRWQKKRLKILKRDDFICQECGARDRTLHVHHKLYFNDLDPWDYDDFLLITYCDRCHRDNRTDDHINTKLILCSLFYSFPQYSPGRIIHLFGHKPKRIHKQYMKVKDSPVAWSHFKKMIEKYFE